jgi:hypothetical protein
MRPTEEKALPCPGKRERPATHASATRSSPDAAILVEPRPSARTTLLSWSTRTTARCFGWPGCVSSREAAEDVVQQTWLGVLHDRFEKHVAGCDGCATLLDQMRTTIRLTGTLTEGSVEGPARDGLARAFLDRKPRWSGVTARSHLVDLSVPGRLGGLEGSALRLPE